MKPTFNFRKLNLFALSPLDGRYATKVEDLREFFSEFALMKYRVAVELKYLKALGDEPRILEVRKFSASEQKLITKIIENFDEKDGAEIKKIEATTNHDVKAVEYFLQKKLAKTSLKNRISFLHFALTSEDVNNLAIALELRDALKKVILPELKKLHAEILRRAKSWKSLAILARTHGQPATPTTLGKEFFVFVARLDRKIRQLEKQEILGKLNGATGNFAAHTIAFPNVDWSKFSMKFVKSLGLTPNLATTQIESHDFICEISDELRGANNISTDFACDIWNYISRGFFKLRKKEKV